MASPVTLDTGLTLTQVLRLLERLEGRKISRSAVVYYGQRTNGWLPLVTPSKRPGSGKGGGSKARLYSVADVILLRWLLRLGHEGLEVRKFYQAVSWLREQLPDALVNPKTRFFITDNRQMAVWCEEGHSIQLSGCPGQILLCFGGTQITETFDETKAMLAEEAA